jgi:catechol 2,3-dioxygenase-like lactoylglutathione lyase family enzyme
MPLHLRVARPVSDLTRSQAMYCQGLGLKVLGSFIDHQGFDGMMLGNTGTDYHFEFTYFRHQPVTPTPTHEDLLVFYLPDQKIWQDTCERMLEAGFRSVAAFNPYWNIRGRTFADPDGYCVVLQHGQWQH